MQRNGRLAMGIAHDLDVAHAYAACQNARAERFAHRFFRGESGGVMRRRIALSVAIVLLSIGEHPVRERRRAIQDAPHAFDFDDIYTQTNRHIAPFSQAFVQQIIVAAHTTPNGHPVKFHKARGRETQTRTG